MDLSHLKKLSTVCSGKNIKFLSPAVYSGGWCPMRVATNALARLMEPAKEIKKDTVNVLYLDAWRTRGVPMKLPLIVQELEAKGITVRRLTSEAALQDFLDGPDAAANLVVSSYMEPLAREMEKQFGTPCFDLTRLFHVSQIEQAYAELGSLLGIDLSDSFSDWHKKAAQLEARAEQELAGKRFVMIPEVDMPIVLTEYLSDFGMEPILIHLDDPMPQDIQTAKRLKKRQIDPPVCRIINDDHDLPMIRDELKPDLTFGYLRNPVPGLATCEEMWDFAGIVGYERTTGILSSIFEVLESGKTKEVFEWFELTLENMKNALSGVHTSRQCILYYLSTASDYFLLYFIILSLSKVMLRFFQKRQQVVRMIPNSQEFTVIGLTLNTKSFVPLDGCTAPAQNNLEGFLRNSILSADTYDLIGCQKVVLTLVLVNSCNACSVTQLACGYDAPHANVVTLWDNDSYVLDIKRNKVKPNFEQMLLSTNWTFLCHY